MIEAMSRHFRFRMMTPMAPAVSPLGAGTDL
jgi:hypothetical protein